jgi:hypothetical protein
MPVGGVACGTVYLSGDGRLYVWDIWNKGQRGVIAQDIPIPEGYPAFRNKTAVDVVSGSNYLNPPTFEKFPPKRPVRRNRPKPKPVYHEGTMALSLLGTGQRTSVEQTPGIAAEVTLQPGESRELTFMISWCFPKVRLQEQFGFETKYFRHAYAARFDDAIAAAKYTSENFGDLSSQTALWVKTWNDSTLPQWLLDRTMATADTLQTGNCLLLDDGDGGRFWAWGRCLSWNMHPCVALCPGRGEIVSLARTEPTREDRFRDRDRARRWRSLPYLSGPREWDRD